MKIFHNEVIHKMFSISFQIVTFSILIISCSGKVTQNPYVTQSTYLSSEYEDKTFKDVSMDICYVNSNHDYNGSLDSLTVSMMINFDDSFRKYFADGIKMFSSVTKTGWIFFDLDENFDYNFIEYSAKTKDGKNFSVSLTDSLSILQRRSESDFLFLVQSITVSQLGPTEADKKQGIIKKYESLIQINYSIWNTKNSDLIAQDIVTTRLEFKKPSGKWPFRGVVLKAASEIFEKLPMFTK